MNLNLENKVALVTGGGRDIGKLISLNLAATLVLILLLTFGFIFFVFFPLAVLGISIF